MHTIIIRVPDNHSVPNITYWYFDGPSQSEVPYEDVSTRVPSRPVEDVHTQLGVPYA